MRYVSDSTEQPAAGALQALMEEHLDNAATVGPVHLVGRQPPRITETEGEALSPPLRVE